MYSYPKEEINPYILGINIHYYGNKVQLVWRSDFLINNFCS